MALWPTWLPSGLVEPGLDLRGGAHLLAEVQVADVYKRPDRRPLARGARRAARRARHGRHRAARSRRARACCGWQISQPGRHGAGGRGGARRWRTPVVTLTGVGPDRHRGDGRGRRRSSCSCRRRRRAATDDRTIQQSLEIIRRRVDEVGTREPTIQRQGADRILIQVPGIGSAAELKALIGTTARLTFNPVVGRTTDAKARAGRAQRAAAVDGRAGHLLHHRADPGGHRRGTGRCPARLRPERPAGGQLPLQPDGRARVRRLHGRTTSARPSPSCWTTR